MLFNVCTVKKFVYHLLSDLLEMNESATFASLREPAQERQSCTKGLDHQKRNQVYRSLSLCCANALPADLKTTFTSVERKLIVPTLQTAQSIPFRSIELPRSRKSCLQQCFPSHNVDAAI